MYVRVLFRIFMNHGIRVTGRKIPMYWIKMQDYSSDRWEQILNRIECLSTRKKVAAIVYWDLISQKPAGTEHYIKDFMRTYKREDELNVSEKALADALIMVGYPKWIAEKRAKPPKNERSNYDYRENKRRGRKER